jgi:hypothetical protein
MEFSDNQDRIFVFRLLFCIFIIVKTIKVRLMGDIIIVLLVFWVVGKLLKGVFGGFSKSSFKDDK